MTARSVIPGSYERTMIVATMSLAMNRSGGITINSQIGFRRVSAVLVIGKDHRENVESRPTA